MMYALIMAGGSGTRLWPLSRENRPKQTIRLVGEHTMFQHAVERVRPVFPLERILVVTRAQYVDVLHEQTPELPLENFIIEPMGRGTAPAIGLGAVHLRRRDPQAVMAVLTADHFITDADRFCRSLEAAEQAAEAGHLVTLGMTPTFPSTAFGYIQQGSPLGETAGFPVYQVQRFVEKPDSVTAARMLATGQYAWNGGMFIWRLERILAEFAAQMPELYRQLGEIEAALGTPTYQGVIDHLWPRIARQTIDYGVMEGARDVVVLPVEIGWADIGSWANLFDLLPTDAQGNIIRGPHLGIDTSNTLVIGDQGRLIATIGIKDLVIVDSGDALLVCPRSREQEVREIVKRLDADEYRSWL